MPADGTPHLAYDQAALRGAEVAFRSAALEDGADRDFIEFDLARLDALATQIAGYARALVEPLAELDMARMEIIRGFCTRVRKRTVYVLPIALGIVDTLDDEISGYGIGVLRELVKRELT